FDVCSTAVRALLSLARRPRTSTLFPYTTLFRSVHMSDSITLHPSLASAKGSRPRETSVSPEAPLFTADTPPARPRPWLRSKATRSEEHTSELQSRFDLVCRLLLEKKKNTSPDRA